MNPNKTYKKAAVGVVHSSNGDITINLSTGMVIKTDGVKGWKTYVSKIAYFDLAEYRKFYNDPDGKDSSFDILDIGYVTVFGEYKPPSEKFRKDIT